MLKRIFLFGIVNILVVVTISLITSLLGLQPYLSASGLNYQSLAIYCLLWGTGGAFISLLLSKFMAKRLMGLEVVDERGPYARLVQKVHHFARKAGIDKMPEVAIYHSNELNAFATGPSKNNSLVAVSTGLMHHMNEDEVDGVLAHEVAHIANGDMVTMTLIQGIVNAFVMFFARIVAFAIDNFLRGDDEEGQGLGYFARFAVTMVLEVVFGFLGMMVVAWFSRWREFRADAGGASLAGRDKMVAALRSLQDHYQIMTQEQRSEPANTTVSALKISNKRSFMALFSTHPALEDRIKTLMGKKI